MTKTFGYSYTISYDGDYTEKQGTITATDEQDARKKVYDRYGGGAGFGDIRIYDDQE